MWCNCYLTFFLTFFIKIFKKTVATFNCWLVILSNLYLSDWLTDICYGTWIQPDNCGQFFTVWISRVIFISIQKNFTKTSWYSLNCWVKKYESIQKIVILVPLLASRSSGHKSITVIRPAYELLNRSEPWGYNKSSIWSFRNACLINNLLTILWYTISATNMFFFEYFNLINNFVMTN